MMTAGSFLRQRVTRRTAAFLLLACAQMLCATGASAAWWNGDWQYRVKIDADTGPKGAQVGEAIGRTQILVRLLANNFKFDSAKQDGSDIRFVAADDRTPLHYHIEKWDGLIDQVALVWVDVPDLAPGASTSITMYWGNAKANDASDSHATYDADQLLVWHFADDNALAHDSTAFGNNALTPGKRDDAAIIGAGEKFDGTAPVKLAPNPTLTITAGAAMTWQMWVKAAPSQTGVLFDQRDAAGVNDVAIGLQAGVPYVAGECCNRHRPRRCTSATCRRQLAPDHSDRGQRCHPALRRWRKGRASGGWPARHQRPRDARRQRGRGPHPSHRLLQPRRILSVRSTNSRSARPRALLARLQSLIAARGRRPTCSSSRIQSRPAVSAAATSASS